MPPAKKASKKAAASPVTEVASPAPTKVNRKLPCPFCGGEDFTAPEDERPMAKCQACGQWSGNVDDRAPKAAPGGHASTTFGA